MIHPEKNLELAITPNLLRAAGLIDELGLRIKWRMLGHAIQRCSEISPLSRIQALEKVTTAALAA